MNLIFYFYLYSINLGICFWMDFWGCKNSSVKKFIKEVTLRDINEE